MIKLNKKQILNIQKNKPPYLMMDYATKIIPGKSSEGYKILKPNLLVSFLKTKKWYTRDEFHKANVKAAIKPYEGLPVSVETLEEISPSFELSNDMFNELIAPVDCENPKDIKF